ncbi:MAG: polyhydroxyalkanoic acid system family protein [Rhodomicrobium sp.]|jgi:putative polyhydroxyalkanoate system protein
MPDIRMRREHRFGLAKARKIAWQWAEQVERDFDMECTVIEGPQRDTVHFTGSGVSGALVVAADHFDLHARLGLLLALFTEKIEAEIEQTLETLLAKAAAKPRSPAKKAAKTAAPRRK